MLQKCVPFPIQGQAKSIVQRRWRLYEEGKHQMFTELPPHACTRTRTLTQEAGEGIFENSQGRCLQRKSSLMRDMSNTCQICAPKERGGLSFCRLNTFFLLSHQCHMLLWIGVIDYIIKSGLDKGHTQSNVFEYTVKSRHLSFTL